MHLSARIFSALSWLIVGVIPAFAGNFEFVVPGEAGLTLSIAGYSSDGSEMFAAISNNAETRDGNSVYIVRIDENILKSTRLAKWCVTEATGKWSTAAGSTQQICDEAPSEMRGSYLFVAPKVTASAAAAPDAAPALAMTDKDATACVQSGLNSIGYAAGPSDGLLGRGTAAASAAFAANQSEGTWPDLTKDSATTWCTQLTTALEQGKAVGPIDDIALLRFGPDVDAGTIEHTIAGMKDIHAYYSESLGGALKTPGTIYISSDAQWLTDHYVDHLQMGEGIRSGKLANFLGCHGGEAGPGFMFFCAKSDVFSGDWFGSGLAAQRTFGLAHEYFHMLQYERAYGRLEGCCDGRNTVEKVGPQWLVEGAAEYVAFKILGDSGRMNFAREIDWHTQKAAEVDVPLSKMQTREGYYAEPLASSAGMIAAHMLAETSGFPALAEFYNHMGAGQSWDTAFETAFGMTPEAFYESYEAEIR